MSTADQSSTPGTRRRRLGYYLVGLAIGLLVLGFFQMARRGEQRARERAAAPVPRAP